MAIPDYDQIRDTLESELPCECPSCGREFMLDVHEARDYGSVFCTHCAHDIVISGHPREFEGE